MIGAHGLYAGAYLAASGAIVAVLGEPHDLAYVLIGVAFIAAGEAVALSGLLIQGIVATCSNREN